MSVPLSRLALARSIICFVFSCLPASWRRKMLTGPHASASAWVATCVESADVSDTTNASSDWPYRCAKVAPWL